MNFKNFYNKDLSEIIEQYYQGDAEKFSIQLTEELDKELLRLKENIRDTELAEKENVLKEGSDNFYCFEKKDVLPEELEKRIYKEIEIIKKIQNANKNKLYSKEDAFALIFGEDYIYGKLSN